MYIILIVTHRHLRDIFTSTHACIIIIIINYQSISMNNCMISMKYYQDMLISRVIMTSSTRRPNYRKHRMGIKTDTSSRTCRVLIFFLFG